MRGAALSAGLYLPTSDVDLVILSSGCTDIVSGLRALAQSLVRKSLATGIQVSLGPIVSIRENSFEALKRHWEMLLVFWPLNLP